MELKRHFGGIFGAIFGGILLDGAESALHYSGELHLETYLELKRHLETFLEASISRKRRLHWSHCTTFGGIIELKRHFGGIFGAIFGGILLGGAESALHSGKTPFTRKRRLRWSNVATFGGIFGAMKATWRYFWRHVSPGSDVRAGVMLRHLEAFLELHLDPFLELT